MQHVTVFGSKDNFAGWPANHGHWQWGDEFLVGFMVGAHEPENTMHAIRPPFNKLLARSMDGGETWNVEEPNVDFKCMDPQQAPPFDLLEPNTIIRACGNYDTGGEHCHREGGFYLSSNRGGIWAGPYLFSPLVIDPSQHNTSRTCVLGNRVFVSFAKRDHWGTDYIVELKHGPDGFQALSTVVEDEHRAVMPAVALIPDNENLVLVCRRKGHSDNWIDNNWIDTFWYDGPDREWRQVSKNPLDTGFANGNPPALIDYGGSRLCCAYGNRTNRSINVVFSDNGGIDWTSPRILAASSNRDLGYPRLFKRDDGKLVCVYYIASSPRDPARIDACIFDPLHFDGLHTVPSREECDGQMARSRVQHA